MRITAMGMMVGLFASSAAAQFVVPTRPISGGNVHNVGFFDWLFGGEDDRRDRAPAPILRPPPEDDGRPRSDLRSPLREGQYRTLCVRLCDGFYFPISFATTRGQLADDARKCERQ